MSLRSSTGLHFLETRYPNATLGRFISADTLIPNPGNPQDFNRYSYGNNNPILFNDPTGHFGFKSIRNKFRKISHSIQKKLGPVGFIFAAIALQGYEPILGTAFLTQSKAGRSVLAGEIIVGTAVASWYCAGCAAAPFLKGAAIGAGISGGFGAYSAAQNGGDISKGLLFGAAPVAAPGALNGAATNAFNLRLHYHSGKGQDILVSGLALALLPEQREVLRWDMLEVLEVEMTSFMELHGAIVGAAVAGVITGVDAFGGFGIEWGGTPPTSPGSDSLASTEFQYGSKITILDPETVQKLTRNPIFSSLTVSGASGIDVLTNGQLTDLAIAKFRKVLEKDGKVEGSF